MRRGVRAPLISTLAALAFLLHGSRALAATPAVTASIASGSPVQFTPTNITNALFPAAGTLTVNLSITTSTTGSGSVAIVAPANLTGTSGSTLNLGLISATCSAGTAGSWFVPSGGSVAIVPGGTSASCATIGSNQRSRSGTFVVTFTINDRYDSIAPIDADHWTATNSFSILATAI